MRINIVSIYASNVYTYMTNWHVSCEIQYHITNIIYHVVCVFLECDILYSMHQTIKWVTLRRGNDDHDPDDDRKSWWMPTLRHQWFHQMKSGRIKSIPWIGCPLVHHVVNQYAKQHLHWQGRENINQLWFWCVAYVYHSVYILTCCSHFLYLQ